MILEVMSPSAMIYKGEVVLVQLPGKMGSFEILQNHAPIIAILEQGKIKVIDEQRNKFFLDISGGTVEVNNNHIVVLTR